MSECFAPHPTSNFLFFDLFFMKAIVCDADILSNLNPTNVAAYLEAKGWQLQNKIPNKVSVWNWETEKDKLKIYLPLDSEFDDFPRRMSDLIATLERVENRSQLDILSELITAVKNAFIQGVVISISQQIEMESKATILGVIVDKLKKINVEFRESDRSLILKAYQERLPIICKGDLIKEGDRFILNNPQKFALDEV